MKRFEFLSTCRAVHTRCIIVEADDLEAAAKKVVNGDYLMTGPDEVEFDYDTGDFELIHAEGEMPEAA